MKRTFHRVGGRAPRIIRTSFSSGLLPSAVKHNSKPVTPSISSSTYGKALRNCSDITTLRQIHSRIILCGLHHDFIATTRLIITYAKCRNIHDAALIFRRFPRKNVCTWNAIIRGFAISCRRSEVVRLYRHMRNSGAKPNHFTIPLVIKACVELDSPRAAMAVHLDAFRAGLCTDLFAGGALIDMYAKFGRFEDARQVFDGMPMKDLVSWTAMIFGFAQSDFPEESLKLFNRMIMEEVAPDSFALVAVLQACARAGALKQGMSVHGHMLCNGFEIDSFVGTGLLDMYAKCGRLVYARNVFDGMSVRNVVCWGAMISGYAQHGQADKALEIFYQMQKEGLKQSYSTVVAVLLACAQEGTLREGICLHGYVVRNGFEPDVVLCTALVDMYCKCGQVGTGGRVFDRMPERNELSWNAMISGYGMHGEGHRAVEMFHEMKQQNVRVDDVIFVSLLCACSHGGLVSEGKDLFECMRRDYGMVPSEKHYGCMVDLLCRAGHLEEAMQFIRDMPIKPGPNAWGALLSACSLHGNVELGEIAAKHLFELEPENSGNFALASKMYAAATARQGKEQGRS